MKIYLAGPMSGHARLNFDVFKAARERLRGLGHVVFCPAEQDEREGFDPDNPGEISSERYAARMARDFGMILECEALALLPGWQESKGSLRELEFAIEHDKKVFRYDALLKGEVRAVDPDTGAQKGTKPARFDLLPWGPLWQLAEHYGIGAAKYAPRNWEKGYAWSLSFAALHRHLALWWCGEDTDPETQSPHLAAVAFHVLALMEYAKSHPEKDDRPANLKRPSGEEIV